MKPKKLFDYKIPLKHQQEDQEELTSIIKTEPKSEKLQFAVLDAKDSFKVDDDSNVFTNNLAEEDKLQKSDAEYLEEGESLSKMEPPNFQSTTSLLEPRSNL